LRVALKPYYIMAADCFEPHFVKHVSFLGRTVPILLQNENGPCPLLAICK
jgi:hypothetical protein